MSRYAEPAAMTVLDDYIESSKELPTQLMLNLDKIKEKDEKQAVLAGNLKALVDERLEAARAAAGLKTVAVGEGGAASADPAAAAAAAPPYSADGTAAAAAAASDASYAAWNAGSAVAAGGGYGGGHGGGGGGGGGAESGAAGRPDQAALDPKLLQRVAEDSATVVKLSLEKTEIAQETYDMIDRYIRKLDEDLNKFEEDFRRQSADDGMGFGAAASAGGYGGYGAGALQAKQGGGKASKRRNAELDAQAAALGGASAAVGFAAAGQIDMVVDPDEPIYCICNRVSYGEMVGCDNNDCQSGLWFHYDCMKIAPGTKFKHKWFCPDCAAQRKKAR